MTHLISKRLQVRLTAVSISITSPETAQELRDLKVTRDLVLAEETVHTNSSHLRWAFMKEKMENISRKKSDSLFGVPFKRYPYN